MAVNLRGVTTVLLAGTGSDDDYVYRAFSAALHDVGAVVVTPAPQPDGLIGGYRDALDNAARAEPIAVGGVSIGAAVAAAWALAHPGHAVAVLAALPAWTGEPDTAPAALAARHSAEMLRRDGLASATAQMRASSPPWLADELTRSGSGSGLRCPTPWTRPPASSRRPATSWRVWPSRWASSPRPTTRCIRSRSVSNGWRRRRGAALRTVTLDEMGADPSVLGAACVAALVDA